ncbi:MAG: hypothetical protein N3D13_02990 [Thermaurantimonas aggregans]|nr:hypothetical protein [Thermaurantimonas aggregans]
MSAHGASQPRPGCRLPVCCGSYPLLSLTRGSLRSLFLELKVHQPLPAVDATYITKPYIRNGRIVPKTKSPPRWAGENTM